MGLDTLRTRVIRFSKWHLHLLRDCLQGWKDQSLLVHLARACNRISAEVKREALSRLPATEILPNESAASECCVGESDTSTILIAKLLVVVGDNHSYREDRAMMTLIQLVTEKWKTLL